MAKLFAVVGHPVAHSLSPQIHAAFARQQGIDLEYRAIDAGLDGLEEVLGRFAAEGGLGANITATTPTAPAWSATSPAATASTCGHGGR